MSTGERSGLPKLLGYALLEAEFGWKKRALRLPQRLDAVALDDVQQLQRRARRPALTALPLAHGVDRHVEVAGEQGL